MDEIPFSIIGSHMMQIPVKVNGEDVKFLMDTGIGPTILSKDFSEKLSLKKAGEFSGERMSGQELKIPMVVVPSIEFGGLERKDIEVGIFDTSGFPENLREIKGILSVGFFLDRVLTINYLNSTLILSDGPIQREDVTGKVTKVPIEVEFDGPSVALFIRVNLPNGKSGRFEVDTGSDSLILKSDYLRELGVDPEDNSVEVLSGTDETGHEFKRYFSRLKGEISLEGASNIMQEKPRAMFQGIIYDGLIGHDFLKRYSVSFDIGNSEMMFYEM